MQKLGRRKKGKWTVMFHSLVSLLLHATSYLSLHGINRCCWVIPSTDPKEKKSNRIMRRFKVENVFVMKIALILSSGLLRNGAFISGFQWVGCVVWNGQIARHLRNGKFFALSLPSCLTKSLWREIFWKAFELSYRRPARTHLPNAEWPFPSFAFETPHRKLSPSRN